MLAVAVLAVLVVVVGVLAEADDAAELTVFVAVAVLAVVVAELAVLVEYAWVDNMVEPEFWPEVVAELVVVEAEFAPLVLEVLIFWLLKRA